MRLYKTSFIFLRVVSGATPDTIIFLSGLGPDRTSGKFNIKRETHSMRLYKRNLGSINRTPTSKKLNCRLNLKGFAVKSPGLKSLSLLII